MHSHDGDGKIAHQSCFFGPCCDFPNIYLGSLLKLEMPIPKLQIAVSVDLYNAENLGGIVTTFGFYVLAKTLGIMIIDIYGVEPLGVESSMPLRVL